MKSYFQIIWILCVWNDVHVGRVFFCKNVHEIWSLFKQWCVTEHHIKPEAEMMLGISFQWQESNIRINKILCDKANCLLITSYCLHKLEPWLRQFSFIQYASVTSTCRKKKFFNHLERHVDSITLQKGTFQNDVKKYSFELNLLKCTGYNKIQKINKTVISSVVVCL